MSLPARTPPFSVSPTGSPFQDTSVQRVADEAREILRQERQLAPSWTDRFTGRGREARLDRAALGQVIRSGRKQALEVMVQTQVAVLREMAEVHLTLCRVHLHAELRRAIDEIRQQLEADLERASDRLQEQVERAYARQQATPHARIRAMLDHAMEAAIHEYFDLADRLRSDFKQSAGLL